MSALTRLDGRLFAAVAVIVFFGVLLGVRSSSGAILWRKVGVDQGVFSFEDLRAVSSSWDCARRGIEPFPTNPCDPFAGQPGIFRATNYPRLWISFFHLGLGEGDTVPLGIAIAVLFMAVALLVPGQLSLGEGVVYAAALLAPATLLGVERGNVDLVMFSLVGLGLLLVRRSPWVAVGPITLAAVMKLFPVAALTVFARHRYRWRAGALGGAVFVAYALATLEDIRTILSVIPRAIQNAYGAGVPVAALHVDGVGWLQSDSQLRWARFAVIGLGLLLAAGFMLRRRVVRRGAYERRLDLFWAGASIYATSYTFDSNFDYRLIFLIFCMPQLCAWARCRTSPLPGARAALAAVVLTLWLSSTYPPLPFGLQTWYTGLSFPPEEILNWLLFAWLLAALAATVPAVRQRRRAAGSPSMSG